MLAVQLSGTRSPPAGISCSHKVPGTGTGAGGPGPWPPRPQGPPAPPCPPARPPPAPAPGLPPRRLSPRPGSAPGPAAPHLLLGLAVALQRLLGQVPHAELPVLAGHHDAGPPEAHGHFHLSAPPCPPCPPTNGARPGPAAPAGAARRPHGGGRQVLPRGCASQRGQRRQRGPAAASPSAVPAPPRAALRETRAGPGRAGRPRAAAALARGAERRNGFKGAAGQRPGQQCPWGAAGRWVSPRTPCCAQRAAGLHPPRSTQPDPRRQPPAWNAEAGARGFAGHGELGVRLAEQPSAGLDRGRHRASLAHPAGPVAPKIHLTERLYPTCSVVQWPGPQRSPCPTKLWNTCTQLHTAAHADLQRLTRDLTRTLPHGTATFKHSKHRIYSTRYSNTRRTSPPQYSDSPYPSRRGTVKPLNLHNGMWGSAALPKHLLFCKVHFSVVLGNQVVLPASYLPLDHIQHSTNGWHHHNHNRSVYPQGCVWLKITAKQRLYKNTSKPQHDITQHKGTITAVKLPHQFTLAFK